MNSFPTKKVPLDVKGNDPEDGVEQLTLNGAPEIVPGVIEEGCLVD